MIMKKIMLFVLLLFSSFLFNNLTVSNAENSENSTVGIAKTIAEREKEEYMKRYQEMYQKSLIQQIEFESEVIIPDYVDFKYIEYAYNLSNELGLQPRTVFRLIYKESCFRDTVVSPAGAQGLMQLMPETRKAYYNLLRIDTLNLDKNEEDIYIGSMYLKDLHEFWRERGNSDNFSWKLSLASYNAGKGKVLRYKGIPPYKETTNFVAFILRAHSNPKFYANILKRNENTNNKDRS